MKQIEEQHKKKPKKMYHEPLLFKHGSLLNVVAQQKSPVSSADQPAKDELDIGPKHKLEKDKSDLTG